MSNILLKAGDESNLNSVRCPSPIGYSTTDNRKVAIPISSRVSVPYDHELCTSLQVFLHEHAASVKISGSSL